KIKCFTLETLSIERILLAAKYCNLYQLNIFCINEEIDIQLFTEKSRLLHIFQKQIVTLCVSGRRVLSDRYSEMYTLANIFSNILLNFTNLLHLKFYSLCDYNGAYLSFVNQSPMFFSSTLVELHINVYYFDDCLYLLDGRLHQLHTLFVRVFHILSFFHSPGIKENDITNNFPRRLFNYVQVVTLFDERPFEHEFFMRLVQAFPFLKDLTITNSEPQKYKQYSNSNDENQDFPIIEYPHLIYLNLFKIHDDYAEQFLLDTKTCFLNNIRLSINDEIIQRVTQNFTRDTTRNNYSKVKTIYRYQSVDLSKYC
ncbi:unnamed protein product, partial [Rotaria sordida]